ncbi:MAG: carboxypeptidase [Rhodobacteraceae bacterium]|jgi:glutamate carboxypeptidase|uniref:Glutamate carboxypeptidase n=1 Tax=Salipiger profundus TaxID=1229727 RepID=A0A1U7D080_9RHOB|nr:MULTISPECIES: M20 family metallopeptidase [Salipiger]APX21559.1 glutamate carboxypeptidase [Salipiger profundus]MAB08959.1 carboxypeptidase [Paracoccaceae bacterium]GGA01491.1 carboxypeptidase [Salipiger profundus]SFC15785.1 glutamate carboxypeptidase [Salipiger profundus]
MMQSEDILKGLMRWVEIDTPTGSVATIARLVDLIASELAPLGCDIERIPGRDGMGDHLVARFAGCDGPGVLVTSHIDTVCAPGSVEIRRDGDRQYGPGIADMKGGGYLALCAMRSIVESGTDLPGPVTLIYNSDEEIGSPTSHALIQAEARKHGAALVPEPARGDEAITFRKGRAKYTLDFHGRESHAGSAFADGRSAILQMARTIGQLEQMTDLDTETTVNVGRVRGGTEPNVVAGHAACDIDVRFADDALGFAVEDALKALQSDDPEVTITLSGEIEKPSLARTPETLAMFARASEINAGLGAPMVETRSGGGSDGNFTCAAGVPTLDGLGAIGNNWHSPQEHILVAPLARREALLRALILTYAAARPTGDDS